MTPALPQKSAGACPAALGEARTCGSCAWLHRGPGGHPRCRPLGTRRNPESVACDLWEPPVVCETCAACCREAYDLVELGRREPVVRLHPELVIEAGGRLGLPRRGLGCVALVRDEAGFRCTIYEDRPRTCREFERGGRHCLEARQRLGLSPRPGAAGKPSSVGPVTRAPRE